MVLDASGITVTNMTAADGSTATFTASVITITNVTLGRLPSGRVARVYMFGMSARGAS